MSPLWTNLFPASRAVENDASLRDAPEAIINRLTRLSALRAAVPVRLDLGGPARANLGRSLTALASRNGGARYIGPNWGSVASHAVGPTSGSGGQQGDREAAVPAPAAGAALLSTAGGCAASAGLASGFSNCRDFRVDLGEPTRERSRPECLRKREPTFHLSLNDRVGNMATIQRRASLGSIVSRYPRRAALAQRTDAGTKFWRGTAVIMKCTSIWRDGLRSAVGY